MENEFLWFFRVTLLHIFLECWKLVKPIEVPNKACVQNRVSAVFEDLRRHEEKKKNIPFYLEIIGKKLRNSYSLAYNVFLYGNLIASLFLILGWDRYNIVP